MSSFVDETICPKCGEENPRDAVMCWNCFTPVGEGAARSRPRLEIDCTGFVNQLPEAGRTFALFLMVGGLISSGWLGRAVRLPILLASVASLAISLCRVELEERKEARESRRVAKEKNPIERIADTLLGYARHDGASQVRLNFAEKGVSVYYLVDEEWREQMKLPGYIWADLREEIRRRAWGERFQTQTDVWNDEMNRFKTVESEFRFVLHFEVEAGRETMLLMSLENGSAGVVS